jgi:transposase-like protein
MSTTPLLKSTELSRDAVLPGRIQFLRDERAAYSYVEKHVWPDGPICPHCGNTLSVGRLSGNRSRVGTHKCYSCRKPFNVRLGTFFESSNVPLHVWLRAIYLLSMSTKSISAYRLQRILGVTQKTASQMVRRVQLASRGNPDQESSRSSKRSMKVRDERDVLRLASAPAHHDRTNAARESQRSRQDALFDVFVAAATEYGCILDGSKFERTVKRIAARGKAPKEGSQDLRQRVTVPHRTPFQRLRGKEKVQIKAAPQSRRHNQSVIDEA